MSDDYDDDYTPSVDQVRETFADAIWDQYGDTPWSHWAEGVDRMIESVRAEERERIAREVCDLAARRAGQYGLDLGLYEVFGIDPTTTREGA